MNGKDNKKIVIGVLIILVLALSVIYAALSTNLNISGQGKIDAQWNIYFDETTLNEQTKKGKIEITNVDLTATTFTLDVALEAPGDKVIYTFDVVNGGTIDAKIAEVILPDLEGTNINCEFTYSDGSHISNGDVLNSDAQSEQGNKKTLKLIITYDESVNAEEFNSSGLSYDLSASILYVQA